MSRHSPPRIGRLLMVAALLILGGCGGQPDDGPIEVKWDRDFCQRCRMVLSDRRHSAQIRYTPAGKPRSRVKLFDDIGCAVRWMEEQNWSADDQAAAQIWVNDWRNGDWIDARTATYIKGQVTPMEYGLGAQSEPSPDGIDFEQARAHIDELERHFNVHGAHLKEQAQQRKEPQ